MLKAIKADLSNWLLAGFAVIAGILAAIFS
jgi:hypothetical protein